MSDLSARLFVLYFAAWFGVAIGSWLFLKDLDAARKKRLYPRVALLQWVVIGGLMEAIVLVDRHYLSALLVLAILSPMAYFHLTRRRLCERCNRGFKARSFVVPVEFCPKCGGPTVRFDSPFGSTRTE